MTSLFDILKKCPTAIPPHNTLSPFTPSITPNLEELQLLMTQHADILSKEAIDRKTIADFINVKSNTQNCTRNINIIPPTNCVDNKVRSFSEYVEYCLGTSIDLYFVELRKQFINHSFTIVSDNVSSLVLTITIK